jgi:hypothetical protein
VTETDGALRDALRDLIPDYTGPVDPLPRVVATVRRRRVHQRTLLAVGGAGLAVVLAVVAPAALLPAPSGGIQVAGPGLDDPPVPSASGVTGPPAPAREVYRVAAGTVYGADWAIGSTSYTADARLCLVSDDDVSGREVVCFDGWTAGDPVTWSAQRLDDKGLTVTRIAGVAPAGTTTVRVRLATGAPQTLAATPTATDRDARFFGLVLPGTVAVRDITALDAAATALGPPVTDPGYSCRPGSNVGCAAEVTAPPK